MDYLIMGIQLIALIMLIVLLVKSGKTNAEHGVGEQLQASKADIINSVNQNVATMGDMLDKSQKKGSDAQVEMLKASLEAIKENQKTYLESNEASMHALQKSMTLQLTQFGERLNGFSDSTEKRLEAMRQSMAQSMDKIREENSKKLDEMRDTVDKKLQTELERRFKESFSNVTALMERVQKEIGGMTKLAEDVGGLQRTLSGVKTRGMLGEFQLESILMDIFPPSQYVKNAHTNEDNSGAVVEFALRIPTEDESFVLLPIDSKFPKDRYEAIIEASQRGDKIAEELAVKSYNSALRQCAKDIKTKYINFPKTTDYALMFLPTESMYADAVNHNMLQEIWQNYRVYITGPSTVSALLSSLQMAFNNITIQKRAQAVNETLNLVKKEFETYNDALLKMKKHLSATTNDLDDLLGTRTNVMLRKLEKITLMPEDSGDSKLLPPIGGDDEG